MTTTPIDAAGAGPSHWVLQRTDPGGDEILPGEDATAGESGLGFGDLLDVINPLQHLPVVGTIYRALTGDTMSEPARLAGGALYGGPLGLVGALANMVVERETGQDIGDTALAWVTDEPGVASPDDLALASAGPARPETQAQPINAAPVTTAAAYASPAAAQQGAARQNASGQDAAAVPVASAGPAGRTEFAGRQADRLDAFIRNTNAVRRSAPTPGAVDPTRLHAAAMKTPTGAGPANRDDGRKAEGDPAHLGVAGADAGSVNEWMLRALDKYEHMRRRETT